MWRSLVTTIPKGDAQQSRGSRGALWVAAHVWCSAGTTGSIGASAKKHKADFAESTHSAYIRYIRYNPYDRHS